jgi:hypothetical protein
VENQILSPDLGDLLTSIECIKRELTDLGTDPTPRIVAWGLLVLRRQYPHSAIFKPSFEDLPLQQQWARVRAYLSPSALRTLEGNLKELQRSLGKQLTLEVEASRQNNSWRSSFPNFSRLRPGQSGAR